MAGDGRISSLLAVVASKWPLRRRSIEVLDTLTQTRETDPAIAPDLIS
jgi:hypothetical protein